MHDEGSSQLTWTVLVEEVNLQFVDEPPIISPVVILGGSVHISQMSVGY